MMLLSDPTSAVGGEETQVLFKEARRRRRRRWLLAAIVAAVGSTVLTLTLASNGSGGTSVVTTSNPYTTTATLRSPLTVAAHDTGFCWESSMEGPNDPQAWRCMSSSEIYDPCFSAPDPVPARSVACLATPWSRAVTVLNLSRALPGFSPDKAYSSAAVWAIQLANGTRCIKGTGAMGSVRGLDIGYLCKNGGSTTLPDNRIAAWTVDYIPADSHAPILQRVKIVTVWRD